MKTKYKIAALLTALLLIPIFTVHAEESPAFTIDQRRVLQGMNRSWLQGYEPKISRNVLSLVLPILSDQAEGTIQTELLMPDEAISPFKPQAMSVETKRSESGLYAVRLNLELYPDRENGDYACTICITGKTRQSSALQTDFPYILRIRDGAPNTEVKHIEISGVQSDFTVGEDGFIRATFHNPCRTVPYEQIVLRVSDPSGEIIPQGADVLYLPDLGPGESAEVTFPMTVLKKATVSPHSLKFDLSWMALGQPITQSESFTRLVMQKAQLEPGGIQAESIVTAGEKWTAALPLMNPGNAEIHSVMASLSLPGLVEKQAVLVGNITPGETKEAQFAVIPGKDVSGDFSGTVAVTGTDGNGNPIAFSVPISLTVENSAEILLSSLRMDISQVQGDLKVGEEGALTATLTNLDPTISFESITLRITDGSGEILPQAADTVYIPALAPGTSYSLSFPVTVLPKAAVSPHSLKFDLSWIANKQTVTQTESYTLPVKQEIRLEQGGLKMASSVIAGDSITLTLPLMNMGKADIINVLATVTLPGITDRQSVLVGTIAPGETRQAQITLTPGKDLSGNYEGSLNVEGTNNDGNPTSFSVPIHLTVEKPVKIAEADDPTTKENEKPSYLIYGLAGGCGLLLLLLLLQGFLLRKKIHRLEEDKL